MKETIEIRGKGENAYAPHQQWVNREGALVRAVRGSPNPIPVGEAYAFFDCNASKEEIENTIPLIRDAIQTPNELELSLSEGIGPLNGDAELIDIGNIARNAGMKYTLKANYPHALNDQTADELSSILNQAYQSPLFKEGEEFRGAIFYKEKGKYLARD